MRMNSSIIMSGVQPDFANALASGVQAGQAVRQAQQQNALADLYKTQGAGIMAGDQNALNALAQISPQAAYDIMGQRQQMDARGLDMQATRQRMDMLTREEARQVEAYAASKTAAERAAEAAQIEDAVKMGMMIQSPEQWDQVMATQAPDLVGQFANRDALAGKYMTMAEILKRSDPPKPLSGAGKLAADFKAGLIDEKTYQSGLAGIGKPGVVVNNGGPKLGSLSTDYGYVLDPNTGEPAIDPATGLPKAAPVPGSPAAQEVAAAGDKKNAAIDARSTASSVIMSAARRARDAAGKRAMGGVGQGVVAGLMPWTDAAEVARQVDVLKSNATIANLSAMRAASPTGGALGSVTEKENAMLAAKAGALDPSSPNFERDLADYTQTLLQIVHGERVGNAIFADQWGADPDQPQQQPDLSDDDLLKKYGG